MKRAARYHRQSPTAKPEDGIDRQRPKTAGLLQIRGWKDVGVYEDLNVSASKERGPGTAWHRLLQDAKAGKFDVVVGVDMDRVLRTTKDLNTLVDLGVALVTVDGEIDLSTADGEFRGSMLASIARFEVRRKGERQSRAQQQRAEKGRPPKGVRPHGYKLDGTVIEKEAETIRRIYHEFAAGGSLKGIAVGLEADGTTTPRGGRWTSSTVANILRNARYCGKSTYKGEIVGDGQWEPIITEDQFQTARGRLQDPRRKKGREGTARKYIGSGVYRCECGRLVRSSGTRYSCSEVHYSRNRDPVDAYVLAEVGAFLARDDLRDLLVKPADESELAQLREARTTLQRRLQRTEQDYDDDLIDGHRYRTKRDKLTAELETIRVQEGRLAASTGPAAVLAAESPVDAFDAASLDLKRATIDALMTVTLHPGTSGHHGFDPETVTVAWRHEAKSTAI